MARLDLRVHEANFEVGLSFDGHPETLVIPFSAIKGFFDPSVQFGLQFDPASAPVVPELAETPAAVAVISAPKSATPPAEIAAEPSGEKVVSLDSFRKKP
jgi:hypothetical protein